MLSSSFLNDNLIGENDGFNSVTRVFNILSRINHSCQPNAIIEWHPTLNQATLQALTKIPQATETQIDYLGRVDDTLLKGEQRREKLMQNYGFECTCAACGPAGGHNAEDDELRLEAWIVHEEIKFEAKLPLKRKDMSEAHEQHRTAQIELLTKYIGLLHKIGIRDGKLLEAHVARAKYHQQGYGRANERNVILAKTLRSRKCRGWSPEDPCHYLGLAMEDWELAEQTEFCVFGKGHPQSVWIGKRLQDIRAEATKIGVPWKATA